MSARLMGGGQQERRAGRYRVVWVCLAVALVLGGVVLLLFGVSWWTAIVAVLLLACPAAIVAAINLRL